VADWVAISALATAGGTLALAATTYGSVRSANRAARAAELSLLAGMRPLLVESSEADLPLHVNFNDVSGIAVPGGTAAVEVIDGNAYVVLSLRNVGSGIAVLHGGHVFPRRRIGTDDHVPLEEIRRLTRDIYIPAGKTGFWQIAFRQEDEGREELLSAIEAGYLTVDVLYGDYEGGQRVVSRYGVPRESDGVWRPAAVRHWQVDRAEPRQRD
jgi:hypothetical protein